MAVELREITSDNIAEVRGVAITAAQEHFVTTVEDSLAEADAHPEGNPWFRAIYEGETPVGFLMLSWNVTPRPPEINGPWFLWKLIIDHRHQGRGFGRDAVRQVVELIRREGAEELLTSHVPGEDGPVGFYAKLGFEPTGALDPEGEIVLRLPIRDHLRIRALHREDDAG